jgi:hypothetical protein
MFTPSPIVATKIASSKRIAGRASRCSTDSYAISPAIAARSTALAKPARSPTLPVPKT